MWNIIKHWTSLILSALLCMWAGAFLFLSLMSFEIGPPGSGLILFWVPLVLGTMGFYSRLGGRF